MRMRKKKNGESRLSACERFLATDEKIKASLTSGEPIYLEIGAGKGGFATGMCRANPDVHYYAMERVTDCVVLATERAKALFDEFSECKNLNFIIDTADNLTRIFPKESIDGIFLNFSDPWSKKGYAKRRLTHRRYLAVYFNLLKAGATLRFKTDNTELFDFSLEEISAMGLAPEKLTYDLHESVYNEGNVVTEYEAAFCAQGVKIKMLEVKKPEGFLPEISRELTPEGREEADERRKNHKISK